MKITLCGSIAFMDEMGEVKKQLVGLGHEVKMPSLNLRDDDDNKIPASEFRKIKKVATDDDEKVWNVIHRAITDHFEKILWSDAILACNYSKREVQNYLGPNTLIELGLALYLKKKIFLLNPVPNVEWKEEILGIQPEVISNQLKNIC